MNETFSLVLAWMAGGILGLFFYGGLWWTISKGISSSQPALWFFGSMLLRMSITLAGFYWFSAGRWERLVACLLGLITARAVVTWFTRPTTANQIGEAKEVGHAH